MERVFLGQQAWDLVKEHGVFILEGIRNEHVCSAAELISLLKKFFFLIIFNDLKEKCLLRLS